MSSKNRAVKADLLLKMNGLRKSAGMSWPDIADVYEAESGERVDPEKLRKRVVSAVSRRMKKVRDEAVCRLSEIRAKDEADPFPRPSLVSMVVSCMKSLFRKDVKLGSRDEEHWVNHICDEFVPPPSPAVQWYNLHGFDEGPGVVYWVGLDCRNFGIRSADYVVRCRTKDLYDEYVEAAHDGGSAFLQKALHDGRLSLRRGGDVGVKFIFRWGDDEKTFNVRLAGDFYAEEK